MMGGMALAVFTYRPIFNTFLNDTNVFALENRLNSDVKIVKEEKTRTFVEAGKNPTDSLFLESIVNHLSNGMRYTLTGPSLNQVKNVHLPSNTYWKFIGLVFILILYVTMVYGPIAAFLVELFPTKIRYTSMSLPYHIGNGVFGGLVPFIGLLLTTTYPADPLVGLWYPIGVAGLCLIIGILYLRNKIDKNVRD